MNVILTVCLTEAIAQGTAKNKYWIIKKNGIYLRILRVGHYFKYVPFFFYCLTVKTYFIGIQ